MAIDVIVSGPMQVRVGIGTSAVLALAPRLGHTREGVKITFQKEYDDVMTDDIGPDVLRDRVLIGEKVFLDFELHSFDRAVLDDFMFLFDTVGESARIGKKISDLDGSLGSIWLGFESETGETDYTFHNVAPLRISQKVGTRHTVVNVRCEATIDVGDSDKFFDNDALAAATGTDAPEVAGGHVITYDGSPLGHTDDGSEIVTDYLYDDVVVDVKGPGTNREKVVTGQRHSWSGEIHEYDETVLKTALANGGTYGQLSNVGKLAVADIGKILFLNSILAASGRDWTFSLAVLEASPTLTLAARHSIATLFFSFLPTSAGVYYVTAVGS